MNINYFNNKIKPILKGYSFKYSSFFDGDFGDLERVEFEGYNKIGAMDIWSKGWLNIDVYDSSLDEQVMNILLSPEETETQQDAINSLLKILLNEK